MNTEQIVKLNSYHTTDITSVTKNYTAFEKFRYVGIARLMNRWKIYCIDGSGENWEVKEVVIERSRLDEIKEEKDLRALLLIANAYMASNKRTTSTQFERFQDAYGSCAEYGVNRYN